MCFTSLNQHIEHLHYSTGSRRLSQSQSRFSTNSQLASASWCQAHSWAFDQKFVFVLQRVLLYL
jgi:hypothetical protein